MPSPRSEGMGGRGEMVYFATTRGERMQLEKLLDGVEYTEKTVREVEISGICYDTREPVSYTHLTLPTT